MSSNLSRWQRLFAVMVIAVMVLALFGPVNTEAKSSNLPLGGLPGQLMKSVRQSHSASLTEMAEMTKKASMDRATNPNFNSGPDGPYLEKLGGFQIPRSTSGNRAETDAAPVNPPDKIVYDDPVPSVDASWNGLNQGANRTIFGFGVYPPDTNGDSSNQYYIETVNVTFAIWDYGQVSNWGGWPKLVFGPAPISTLFAGFGGACEFSDDGDPIVLYDEHADRWLISQFALPYYPNPPFSECIAVSATSDPLGAWYRYEYQFNKMNDYPHFGIWQDGYYMTINQFQPGWQGQGVVVFDRQAMLKGLPANAFYWDLYGYDPNIGGMLPADNDGFWAPAGAPGITITMDDDAWGYSGDQLQVWEWYVNWSALTATGVHAGNLAVNSFDSEVCAGYSRNCIPQPGTTRGLDALSDRLMYRLQYRNFGTYQTLVANHTVDMNDPAGHAGIRWYELRNYGSGWSIYQEGDYSPDADYRWMGSIAMDASGNIALGFSKSNGTTLYPNMAYTGRKPADPLGTMPLVEGLMISTSTAAGSQTGTASRWGDYSSMSVLPDGCTFVYANEYMRGTTPAEWYTMMAMFDFNTDCVYNSTSTFVSQPGPDGYTQESSETSNMGGTASAAGSYIQIGDTTYDRQLKGFLSFDTSSLAGAVITNARIEMRYAGVSGTNPFTTHGPLKVDFAPFFGAGVNLAPSDFQAAAALTNVGTCGSLQIGGWYACGLDPAAVNAGGISQYRLYFTMDDNDDGGIDFVKLFSGNYGTAAYRPVLIVEYYWP